MKTNETIELEDLALTEDQQAAVKGGPTMEDCLAASYQSGGHEGSANPGAASLVTFNTAPPGTPSTMLLSLSYKHNQTICHQDSKCKKMQSAQCFQQSFIATCQAAEPRDPAEAALYYPTPGQQDEAFLRRRQLGYFQT